MKWLGQLIFLGVRRGTSWVSRESSNAYLATETGISSQPRTDDRSSSSLWAQSGFFYLVVLITGQGLLWAPCKRWYIDAKCVLGWALPIFWKFTWWLAKCLIYEHCEGRGQKHSLSGSISQKSWATEYWQTFKNRNLALLGFQNMTKLFCFNFVLRHFLNEVKIGLGKICWIP